MKRFVVVVFLAISFAASAFQGPSNYDFLKKFRPKNVWTPEHDVRVFPDAPKPLDIDLSEYYAEFEGKKGIQIYVGGGAEIWSSSWTQNLHDMIKASNEQLNLGIKNLKIEGRDVQFQDKVGRPYVITVGNDREEFIDALKEYPIVIYLGHSRYGRGPAFKDMTYYFRLGDVFPVIEVDTRNKYFLSESLMETDLYPPESVWLDGNVYQYQYKGEKDESSHLPSDSYTKRIEGGPKDFMATEFAEGKQLIFLYSCSNVNYFLKPIRSRFTNPEEKLIFGTLEDAAGDFDGVAIFIVSLIQKAPTSLDVVKELNKLQDLFTAY